MCEIAELLILVVDNEKDVVRVCRQIKKDTGVHRIQCASGLEAAELFLEEETFDMIFVRQSIDPCGYFASKYKEAVVYYGESRHNTNTINAFVLEAARYVNLERGFSGLGRAFNVAIEKDKLRQRGAAYG